MLRKIRIIISVAIGLLITLYFLDFAKLLPMRLHFLESIQLVPALLALNVIVLLVLFGLTFLLGRVYCSTICPLGLYQDAISRVARLFKKKKKRFKYSKPLTILRWSVLGVIVVAFFTGFSFLLGLFDPYSAYGRITVHLFKPVYLFANNILASVFTKFGSELFYRTDVFITSILSFIIGMFTFLIVGYLSWANGRIYCNSICPVGTLLGFVSRFSIFKVRIDEKSCNSCGACGRSCKSSCIDTKNHQVDYSRCVDCFDCLEVCTQDALHFSYAPVRTGQLSDTKVDTSKRSFMLAVGVTSLAASTKILASNTVLKIAQQKVIRKTPISPPGSLSADHLLQNCTSCHLCVSKCPSNVIKPSFMEYGIGGIMQPMLYFDKGFCNYDCTICSDVCPSGALVPLSEKEKHTNQMGQVQFDIEKCIVYTDGTNCGACSEHCPTQAVSMVTYKGSLTIPKIDVSICVGCGGCEHICPSTPQKAIYVEGVEKHQKLEIKKQKVEKVKVDSFGF